MAIVWLSGTRISGLNADSKPTTVPANTQFFETDTDEVFNFNGTTWDKISIPSPYAAGDTTTGVFNQARLGSGTGTSAKLLMGDTVWETFFTSQRIVKSTSFSTSSTSFVTITGVTLTLANRSGGNAIIGLIGKTDANSGNNGEVELFDDGTSITNTTHEIPNNSTFQECVIWISHALDGSVIDARMQRTGGTGSINWNSEVEDTHLIAYEFGGT